MAKKNKIVIGLATQRLVFSKMCFSLVHALKDVPFEWDFLLSMACDIVSSRTNLVRMAKEQNATHLCFVDYDMAFYPDRNGKSPITALLEEDKDIIGAAYNRRKEPIESTATPKEGEDTTKPFKAEVVGAGLMLIKMSVFDKIEPPYFNFGRNSEGQLVQGEDTFFCRKAIAAGIDVWAHPNLLVKHIGEYEY